MSQATHDRVQQASLTLHQLFDAAAARRADHPALVQGDRSLSYAELAERSDAIRAHLTARGIGPGSTVAVRMDRSLAWPAALLGILKAGAAYVPLDVRHPRERVEYVLGDAQVGLVLVSRHDGTPPTGQVPVVAVEDAFETGVDLAPSAAHVAPSAPAYVLYTSGTTGRPKGVCVEHSQLVHSLRAVAECYGIVPEDRVLQFSALTFDVAAEELFATLISGATVVLRDAGPVPDIGELVTLADRADVSVLNLPGSYWHQWVSELSEYPPSRCGSLRLVVVGSEAVDAGKLATWQAVAPAGVRWLNAYGPTETTITATVYEPPAPGTTSTDRPSGSVVPIGRPLPGVRAYVLDDSLRPLPPDVPGDLYIAGPGVARGYLGDPARTEASFLPDPWGGPGERMFATKDRVRRSVGGLLEFLGRSDDQVKLRGFRIELSEIEHVLRTHPRVTDAVVVLREDRPGDQRLVGYVTSARGTNADTEELVAELRALTTAKLPEYMVPTNVLALDALPVNSNGKIDRRALPVPPVRDELYGEALAPRTPTEHRLSAIWSDVLGIPTIGVDDDFFRLGGHSLLATQIMARVRKEFRVDLSLRRLFDHPTVAGLAGAIQDAAVGTAARKTDRIPVADRPPRPPLSFSQQRMWFMDQLVPDNAFFNVVEALRLTGPVDADALQGALDTVVDRHEVLRTSYPSPGGQPHQAVAEAVTVPLDKAAAVDEEQARDIVMERIRIPFDLSEGPVIRAGLIQLADSDSEHVLWICVHHIAYDEWSNNQLLRELSEFYTELTTGRPAALAVVPLQYADFAMWHRDWVTTSVRDQQIDYWRKQLAGAPPALPLPTDMPRPRRLSQRGAAVTFRLDPEVAAGLRNLARAQGCTPFMVLLTLFGVLLQRHGAGDDVPVATPVANRTRQETEDLVGLFFNTLVLRLDLSGEAGFSELLRRTKDVAVGAYEHQDLPFEHLVEALRPTRDPSRNPLAQVLFQLHSRRPGVGELSLPGVTARQFEFAWTTVRVDLEWHLREVDDTFTGIVAYATDLFEHATVANMVADFEALATAVLAAPGHPLSAVPLAGARGTRGQEVDDAPGDRPRDEESAGGTPSAGGVEEIQQVMCGIWAKVLNLDEVALDDDFFDLGGQSLLATQLISRIDELFGVRIPLSELFDQSTVGGLAELVAEAKGITTEDVLRPDVTRGGEAC
ncbi:amino acid adenylation domain-containing protein [Streptomyces erythrochromogenes]|uniref:amino acid adenylation domain-containing protein n=1 Tax=Streptomyces erythrochromogenes TaxID=285574 RepID=UPI002259158B|nr:amino acid adenylation domain-containing protein [Streptomyces erythrochromogenes]MCX5586274.1 amino acid adenylation domain-containing protein [Streptomyces erythrochromogenes]